MLARPPSSYLKHPCCIALALSIVGALGRQGEHLSDHAIFIHKYHIKIKGDVFDCKGARTWLVPHKEHASSVARARSPLKAASALADSISNLH